MSPGFDYACRYTQMNITENFVNGFLPNLGKLYFKKSITHD